MLTVIGIVFKGLTPLREVLWDLFLILAQFNGPFN